MPFMAITLRPLNGICSVIGLCSDKLRSMQASGSTILPGSPISTYSYAWGLCYHQLGIGNHCIKSLAYADDLCVVAQSPAVMQQMLDVLQTASTWAGFTFNPKKCGSLTLSRSARQFAEVFSPRLGGEAVRTFIKVGRPLQVPGMQGRSGPQDGGHQTGVRVCQMLPAIMESGLTDWQKLDASTSLLNQDSPTSSKTPYPTDPGHNAYTRYGQKCLQTAQTYYYCLHPLTTPQWRSGHLLHCG